MALANQGCRFFMSELDLAALLVSRVCHDLISPVGAISNGMEILADEQDPDMRAHALTLIGHSVGQARARLLFARLAFGAMGSAGAEISLREAAEVAKEFFQGGKVKVVWDPPEIAMNKEIVKIALNLAAMAADCIPRGGNLTINSHGDAKQSAIVITAEGPRANLAQDIIDALAMKVPQNELTGRTIAPLVTAMLAKRLKSEIKFEKSPERIVFRAAFAR
jgi:histidine phosphotransferase ChpT